MSSTSLARAFAKGCSKVPELPVSCHKVSCHDSSTVLFAGSERAAASGAEGSQLREACAINSSLSALSSVISKLTEAQRLRREGAVLIPYRDSRLTFLLRVRSKYPWHLRAQPPSKRLQPIGWLREALPAHT